MRAPGTRQREENWEPAKDPEKSPLGGVGDRHCKFPSDFIDEELNCQGHKAPVLEGLLPFS